MIISDSVVASNAIYDTYPADYVAIVQAAEDTIVAVLSVTLVHRLYLPAALLAYWQAALPMLETVSANTHLDLDPAIILDHLRTRAKGKAAAVLHPVGTRIAESQRFASARFREKIEVARRGHRIEILS